MPYVAVYCRISQDREERAENVATQERKGRAYAAEHWPDLQFHGDRALRRRARRGGALDG